ncbi:hypothetical protein ACWCWD_25280 [Streptomyces sp. NPDC001493]
MALKRATPPQFVRDLLHGLALPIEYETSGLERLVYSVEGAVFVRRAIDLG